MTGLPPAAQRARGAAELSVRRRGTASAIGRLRQAGSSKILFPHGKGPRLQAVWLNTAGGITGGDRFDLDLHAGEETCAVLTSQAAERVYRAADATPGRVTNRLWAGAGARIDWLPQETILYDGAALDRRLEIALDEGAACLACETLIFGRAAMGERVRRLHLRDRMDVRIGGRLVYADRLRLDGDAAAALERAHVAGGGGAVATLVLAGPGAEARLGEMRAGLPEGAGASAPHEEVATARIVAADGFEMRRTLIPLLRALSGAELPRPWTI